MPGVADLLSGETPPLLVFDPHLLETLRDNPLFAAIVDGLYEKVRDAAAHFQPGEDCDKIELLRDQEDESSLDRKFELIEALPEPEEDDGSSVSPWIDDPDEDDDENALFPRDIG